MLADNVQSAITFLKTRDLDTTTSYYIRVFGSRLVLDQVTCRIFAVRPVRT